MDSKCSSEDRLQAVDKQNIDKWLSGLAEVVKSLDKGAKNRIKKSFDPKSGDTVARHGACFDVFGKNIVISLPYVANKIESKLKSILTECSGIDLVGGERPEIFSKNKNIKDCLDELALEIHSSLLKCIVNREQLSKPFQEFFEHLELDFKVEDAIHIAGGLFHILEPPKFVDPSSQQGHVYEKIKIFVHMWLAVDKYKRRLSKESSTSDWVGFIKWCRDFYSNFGFEINLEEIFIKHLDSVSLGQSIDIAVELVDKGVSEDEVLATLSHREDLMDESKLKEAQIKIAAQLHLDSSLEIPELAQAIADLTYKNKLKQFKDDKMVYDNTYSKVDEAYKKLQNNIRDKTQEIYTKKKSAQWFGWWKKESNKALENWHNLEADCKLRVHSTLSRSYDLARIIFGLDFIGKATLQPMLDRVLKAYKSENPSYWGNNQSTAAVERWASVLDRDEEGESEVRGEIKSFLNQGYLKEGEIYGVHGARLHEIFVKELNQDCIRALEDEIKKQKDYLGELRTGHACKQANIYNEKNRIGPVSKLLEGEIELEASIIKSRRKQATIKAEKTEKAKRKEMANIVAQKPLAVNAQVQMRPHIETPKVLRSSNVFSPQQQEPEGSPQESGGITQGSKRKPFRPQDLNKRTSPNCPKTPPRHSKTFGDCLLGAPYGSSLEKSPDRLLRVQ